jgi:hypothetical protein
MMSLRFSLVFILLLGGCDEPTASIGQPCGDVLLLPRPATDVSVAVTATTSLVITSMWPDDCSLRAVDWASASPGVASVVATSDTTAVVTGRSTGVAIVTATLRPFPAIKRQFTITVSAATNRKVAR